MTIRVCRFGYEDGHTCGEAAVARDLCARHYAQDKRGRLGKTREIERGSEQPVISVSLRPETLAALDAEAKRRAPKGEKPNRSALVEEILSSALG